MMERYWKQFAALATGWWRKYLDDPFFRTEVNVVALQIGFAALILVLVGTSFTLLYKDVATAILSGIHSGLATSSPQAVAPAIVQEIQNIRAQNLGVVVVLIVIATAVVGYIVARIALAPTRNALSAQKQFIGNIAHELRTPLAIIKTNTEIALLENNMAVDLRKSLQSNIEEMDRISEIINNLLSLSALIKPERMEFSPVDLSDIASDVVAKFEKLARVSGHQVTLKRSPDSIVWGNRTALLQIVSNLVKNAINYTPSRGVITVSVAPAPHDEVELSVQDTGVGIARKDLFRIFEPFYRTDQSRTRGKGGTGLGLAIVSELVKFHHGKIVIRSAIGRGTTVSILFPAAPDRPRVGGSEKREGLNEIAVDFSSGGVGRNSPL